MKHYPLHLALLASLSCLPASAQVAFIVDVMTYHMCIANNWDTPSWKMQFAQLSDTQKDKLRKGLEVQLSPQGVLCLEKTRPYPEEACAKVIDRARQGMPSVGGGEPFVSPDLDKELERGSEKAFSCLNPRRNTDINDR